jgi:membrane associated rhomboid family serine protease
MTKTNRQGILFATSLVGLIVGGYAVQVFAWPRLGEFGLAPRTARGLIGIFSMPFLHASVGHLLANLTALVVLLGFVFAFHSKRLPEVVIRVILVGGILLWIFGRPANHVGASGLIYGLAAFVIVSGIVQRRFLPVAAAIGVAVMYGSPLFWGLVPVDPGISWDGHLAGGLAGALAGRNRGGRW